jgi:hypothetical protein
MSESGPSSLLERYTLPEDEVEEVERLKREYNAPSMAEGFDPDFFTQVRVGGTTNYDNEKEWKIFARDASSGIRILYQPVAIGIRKLSHCKTRYVVLNSAGERLSNSIALSGRHNKNVNAKVSLEAFRFIESAWASNVPRIVMKKLVKAHRDIGTVRITCELADKKRRRFLRRFGFTVDGIKNFIINPSSF